VRGGDAACQVVGLAFASGVSELGVVGEPEEIGVGKGGGVESDAVEGVAGERKCAVGGVHGFSPHPDPLPGGEREGLTSVP